MLQRLKETLLPPGETVERIRFGALAGVRVRTDRRNSLQLLFGLWERETYTFLRRAFRRCAWAVDIGAGAGELPIRLALATAMRPIIAIDASARVTARLAENAELNGVSDRIAILTAFAGAAGQPLDRLPVPREARGFLKIDVDGAEMDVLASGRSLLAGPRDLLIETHSAELEAGCRDFLTRLGYAVTIIPNAWWRFALPEQRQGHNRWLWAERPA